MPDGGNFDPKVIEEITKEVRRFGDDWKQASESMQRDLTAVRKLAEEAKSTVEPTVKTQIDALTASVLEKQAAVEKASGDRMAAVETKLGRLNLGTGGAGDNDERQERRDAIQFHKMTLAARGLLRPGMVVKDEDIDFASIKGWGEQFSLYLRSKDDRALETRLLNVGSDPDGGYWVPTATSNRIITQIFETSPMRSIANVETISTDALEIPNDFGEFGYGWVGEQEARPETTTSQTGVQRITVDEMYAMPRATQKLLEDATIDVEGWMARKVSDKFSRVEATAFITGSGVKQPRGILTYASGTTLPGTVEQITSGAATALTTDGLIRIMIALKDPYAPGAQWLMRRATVGAVMLLKDGDGQYIWRAGLDAGKPSILLGYPVTQAADMPAVAAGTLSVAFGNWREAYTIVDRLGITTLRDPYTAKPFVLFYTRRRVGGDVVNFEAYKLMVTST